MVLPSGGKSSQFFRCSLRSQLQTKDRTLEEIDEMFDANLPPRKFKNYVCVQVKAIADQVDEKHMQQTVENVP